MKARLRPFLPSLHRPYPPLAFSRWGILNFLGRCAVSLMPPFLIYQAARHVEMQCGGWQSYSNKAVFRHHKAEP